MRKFWVIVKEVYRKNILSPFFLFMTLGPILAMLVMSLITSYIVKSKIEENFSNIAMINVNSELQTYLAEETTNHYLFHLSEDEAKEALIKGEIDGYIIIDTPQTIPLQANFFNTTKSKNVNISTIETAINQFQFKKQLSQKGIDLEVIHQLEEQKTSIQTLKLSVNQNNEIKIETLQKQQSVFKIGMAYVTCMIVYFFIIFYISIISQEIAGEKGSHIMEIILSSISANQHFLAKMLSVLLVALTQVFIYIVLFFISKQFISNTLFSIIPMNINIFEMIHTSSNEILGSILFAIFGILTYASLAGFLGSLVSKIEDVNKSIAPLILLTVIGFYIGLFSLSGTNNTLVRVASLIPFFTPFVMPFRIAAETVTSSELLASVIISLLFLIVCLKFSIIFYKSNALVTTDKGIIQAFKRSYTLWKSEKKSNR